MKIFIGYAPWYILAKAIISEATRRQTIICHPLYLLKSDHCIFCSFFFFLRIFIFLLYLKIFIWKDEGGLSLPLPPSITSSLYLIRAKQFNSE